MGVYGCCAMCTMMLYALCIVHKGDVFIVQCVQWCCVLCNLYNDVVCVVCVVCCICALCMCCICALCVVCMCVLCVCCVLHMPFVQCVQKRAIFLGVFCATCTKVKKFEKRY